MAGKPGEVKRARTLSKGRADYAHHENAGKNEVDVAYPTDLIDALANHLPEDENIQECANPWGNECLASDSKEPLDFASDDGLQADPVTCHASPSCSVDRCLQVCVSN